VTYIIFEVKSENVGKINSLAKDDLVSRQSILTRDASSLDMDEGLKRAKELAKELKFKKLGEKKAKKVDEKIKEQEDSAASGMGMIFD